MLRRHLVAALAALPVAPGLLAGCAAAPPQALDASDQALLARVQTYLNATGSLQARFVQASGDEVGTGRLWIERPGRLRLQYDPPSRTVLVAARGRVVYANGATGASSSLPLTRTPMAILLAPEITLSGAVTVVSVQRTSGAPPAPGAGTVPGGASVTLRSTERPGQGRVTLLFSDPPLALHGVVLVDGRGDATRLALSDVRIGGTVDEALFQLPGA